ncbi:unnamed protein product [Protopolystoma xenopodis]|uniref:Uncharacterized protein n=1 Tax=Protopolystoma xenopodis TaxID=117903 RepID=A0A3S5AQG4_9PLAT|nr:unnamed protein product [Protopolystoma xenopodis]
MWRSADSGSENGWSSQPLGDTSQNETAYGANSRNRMSAARTGWKED